jgi:hypothetical protein
MYPRGQGVAIDDGSAVSWCRKAAEQGDAQAQCFLGVMYKNGRGVAKDDSTALGWYHKAAEQGSTKAQFGIGAMYHRGTAVTSKNEETAADWYRRALGQRRDRTATAEEAGATAGPAADPMYWLQKCVSARREEAGAPVVLEACTWYDKCLAPVVELKTQQAEQPNVCVVGVHHGWPSSVRKVQDVIRHRKPACVALESCEERAQAHLAQWESKGNALWMVENATSMHPLGRLGFLLEYPEYSVGLLIDIALGRVSGGVHEMNMAAAEAEAAGARSVLIDRCISTSNKRQAAAPGSFADAHRCALVTERDYIMAHRLWKAAHHQEDADTGV